MSLIGLASLTALIRIRSSSFIHGLEGFLCSTSRGKLPFWGYSQLPICLRAPQCTYAYLIIFVTSFLMEACVPCSISGNNNKQLCLRYLAPRLLPLRAMSYLAFVAIVPGQGHCMREPHVPIKVRLHFLKRGTFDIVSLPFWSHATVQVSASLDLGEAVYSDPWLSTAF